MSKEKEYFAFISYQREDEEWAKWLAHELEHYHLPLTLNGRDNLPKDLRPIFRDIDELSAGNLPHQIHKALVNSQHLIVICSPRSAKSPWVNKEIQEFINLGKTDKIFPFIIDGIAMCKNQEDPQECFPPALRNLPKSNERLGANVNENGHGSNMLRVCTDCPIKEDNLKYIKQSDINEKGRDAAVVKIIAGMLGLSFDTLWQRYEREKAEEERKIKEQRDNLLKVQSRFLAEKVNVLVDEGNSYTARLLALEALPKNLENPDRPYVPEVEMALRYASLYSDAILNGHTGAVLFVSYSMDGKYIVSASKDNTIRVWNAKTGRQVGKPLRGHTDFVNSVSFSPDGKYIVSASHDKTIRIWDAKSGDQIGESLKGHIRHVYSAFFSPDGNYIVSASADKTIRIWDVKTSKQIKDPLKGHTNFVRFASFSPDGKQIVSASYDNSVKIWDFETGKQVKSLEKHTFFVKSASFSPNSKYVVSASQDKTIIIWNLEKDNSMVINGHADYVNSISFSPDGKCVVSASKDKTIKLWDVETGQQVGETIEGHFEEIYSASFSPDGRQIVSASEDSTIRLWDIKKSEDLYYLPKSIVKFGYSNSDVFKVDQRVRRLFKGNTKLLKSVSFSPDGKYVTLSSKDGTIKIWDTNTGQLVGRITGKDSVESIVSFIIDENFLISASDNTIRIWDVKTGRQVSATSDVQKEAISTASVSPDGKTYVSVSPQGTIRKWKVISTTSFSPEGKSFIFASLDGVIKLLYVDKCGIKDSFPETIEEYDYSDTELFGSNIQVERLMKDCAKLVNTALYSPDGKYIVSASNNSILIWNAETQQQIGEISNEYSEDATVSFSLDGKYIAIDYMNGTIRIWKIQIDSGLECKSEISVFFDDSKSISPDGKLVASASGNYTIIIRDAKTNERIGNPLVGHTNYVWTPSFSPDGKYIVSPSQDKTIRIWDVNLGTQVGKPLEGHTDAVMSVSFSPDGRYIVSYSKDKTIRIWDVSTGKQICMPIENVGDDIWNVAFCSNGKYIVSQYWDGTLGLWEFCHLQDLINQERERYKDANLTHEERERFYLD